MYKVLDLFSGAGGFSLGLERTGGFKTVAFCEIEPLPRKILSKHWPEVPCYNDVRELDARRLHADGIFPDVIVGGFPCQDISLAGLGKGLQGDQSKLFFESIRLIRELRPEYVILENVAALVKKGLSTVLAELAEIGYDAEWDCIPATFVGAPHNRDRVWIVAYPKRDEQSRSESCFREIGRVGRIKQPVPWDAYWKDSLSRFRGLDDGFSRDVARLAGFRNVNYTDLYRNAVVPQIPELIGEAILKMERNLVVGR